MFLRTPLKPDQKKAAKFTCSRFGALVSYGTGTGKGYIQIVTSLYLIKHDKVDKFIFVCTKSGGVEIVSEFEKHTNVIPVFLSSKEDFITFMDGEEKVAVFEYNAFERMVLISDPSKSSKRKKMLDKLAMSRLFTYIKQQRVGVCFDEVHKLMKPSSRTTKFFRYLRKSFKFRFGFTATPIMSDLYNIFNIVEMLSPGKLGTWKEFTDNYMVRFQLEYVQKGKNGKPIFIDGEPKMVKRWEVSRYKNLDDLSEQLEEVMIRYFPEGEVTYINHKVELEEDLRKEYILAARGVLESADEDEKKSHSARIIDLQRIVDSSLNKQNAFLKVVKEHLDQGLLVYGAFYDTIDILKRILDVEGIEHKEITGRVSSREERREIRDWFIEDPKKKVLLLSTAGGQSLNLQATPHLIFYNIPFGIGYYIQILGRVVREFSLFDAFFIHSIVTLDSIDIYKYNYIYMHRVDFERVVKNTLEEKTKRRFQGFNAYLLKELRKSLLWK